ncbi:MAG TPA: amidophosphoribosyltransferase [Peptococcaceae bacterium]|nr:MAG: Amidophosphoribosyltransferase [Clostridia bacterium 41_269]HBT20749.1 amidophosphoribosyltransferase [Peptococcaceae bacterium]
MSDALIFDFEEDKVRDECGIFGIYGPGRRVSRITYYGLHALQHRGQESAGIGVSNGKDIKVYKGMGLVTEVFNESILKELKGKIAVGHVRYSTTGSSSIINAQPMVFRYYWGMAAFAHNGNLVNSNELENKLGEKGAIFQSTSDTEIIANLIARCEEKDVLSAVKKVVSTLEGAYSLIIMTQDKLIAVRDSYGFRPLCLGDLDGSPVVASETCALNTVGAKFVRDIKPGEIVVIDENGIDSIFIENRERQGLCVFEYVYLARPDSNIDGKNVNLVRLELGRQLAKEAKIDADMVISVPDSGTSAAIGYAQEANLPYMPGLIKNRYVGRTFIQPTQKMRDLGVRLKLNPVREILNGKRVIMIDDSIVRGTTSRKIVQLVREAGAKEVHMMASSPPIKYPCYYGIDTSSREELIAAQKSIDEICMHIGADSLHYLSLEGLIKAVGLPKEKICVACFNGDYLTEIPQYHEKIF